MPCLNLSTNVSLDGVDTSAILSEASKTVARLIGKPESVRPPPPHRFAGSRFRFPAAYGELVSIGGLNPDVNKKLSAAVAAILETKLSVPKTRFFLKFYDTKVVKGKLCLERNGGYKCHFIPRFSVLIYTARYGRYIPVRQDIGMRTTRYRAILSKSAVGGHFRPSAIDLAVGGRFQSSVVD
ncbi:hypothetical protein BHM03_00017767 [Ensete ventricosum]|nr:hypothetical protein BHM03_00017767 [Ensete ventricosum]